jgi:hypothetical protein
LELPTATQLTAELAVGRTEIVCSSRRVITELFLSFDIRVDFAKPSVGFRVGCG